ncbi:MAG: MarR family winged helix-turn-helix transcriptional regulator [Firmicutes bacterium]|nr:MarR family winged helix-turn-helix transcriptional regulator [Bacillota bacterium]MDY5531454.1 MarR family winged helix-turn-helix transcriptional regulator [Pumilibacteraceae bacterium]
MKKISERVIDLRIATRRACMCENVSGKGKNTLSLKTKVLYLIAHDCGPRDIQLILCIAKTNLALITASLTKQGLIVKSRDYNDRRHVRYAVTGKGRKYLSTCLDVIEKSFASAFPDKESYGDALKKLEDALEVFSFINN